MMRALVVILALVTPAFAQQPDPATMQKAITVLQQQRNSAMDQAASAQTEAMRLADEVAKLKAEIAELQKGRTKPD